jgi:ribonuclease-3
MNARAAAVEELEQRIGYVFADRELLERALTHASVKGSRRVKDNQRLEFLGDRVLNLIVAEHLMRLRPDSPEGELSKLMSQLVNFNACADVAREVGIPAAMRFDASATRAGARDNDRVLGDACEALIAALYREAGLERTREFILALWSAKFAGLNRAEKDPKTLLQEWAMARRLPTPDYVLVNQAGPAHEPMFTIEARLSGFEPVRAEAKSKREGERITAQIMLARIEGVK